MLSSAHLEEIQEEMYIRFFDNVGFELICGFKIVGNNLKSASKKYFEVLKRCYFF